MSASAGGSAQKRRRVCAVPATYPLLDGLGNESADDEAAFELDACASFCVRPSRRAPVGAPARGAVRACTSECVSVVARRLKMRSSWSSAASLEDSPSRQR
eukprot:6754-Pleurochrysis_carterae.AAC.3